MKNGFFPKNTGVYAIFCAIYISWNLKRWNILKLNSVKQFFAVLTVDDSFFGGIIWQLQTFTLYDVLFVRFVEFSEDEIYSQVCIILHARYLKKKTVYLVCCINNFVDDKRSN